MLLRTEPSLQPPYPNFCAWLLFCFVIDAAVGEEEVQIPQQESFVNWQLLGLEVRTLCPCLHAPAQLNNLGSSLHGSVPVLQSHFRCVHLAAVQLQY